MSKTNAQLLEEEVKRLREENSKLRQETKAGINPVYLELVKHLIDGPKTISQLAELMTRENRTISQYLHQLKVKFAAEIITLNRGEKQLLNPQVFIAPSDKNGA